MAFDAETQKTISAYISAHVADEAWHVAYFDFVGNAALAQRLGEEFISTRYICPSWLWIRKSCRISLEPCSHFQPRYPMEAFLHSQAHLFAQLGLPSAPEDIRRFINTHCPLPDHVSLHEAPFWNASQAKFLLESIQNDADWSEAIDSLSVALRQPRL